MTSDFVANVFRQLAEMPPSVVTVHCLDGEIKLIPCTLVDSHPSEVLVQYAGRDGFWTQAAAVAVIAQGWATDPEGERSRVHFTAVVERTGQVHGRMLKGREVIDSHPTGPLVELMAAVMRP